MVARSRLLQAPPYQVEQALKRLGENLRTARIRRKLTIEDVAQKIGTGPRAVMDAEKGKPSTTIGAYAALLFGDASALDDALAALEASDGASADPWASFRIGVARTLRHDSEHVRPGDLQRAFDTWTAALVSDPSQQVLRECLIRVPLSSFAHIPCSTRSKLRATNRVAAGEALNRHTWGCENDRRGAKPAVELRRDRRRLESPSSRRAKAGFLTEACS